VPATATTGKITVQVGSQTVTGSADFMVTASQVTAPPVITNISPAQGTVGTTVTITGTNFSTTPAGNVVKFNSEPAAVSAATATSLTVTVPATATMGKITVQVGSQTVTSSTDFTITVATPIVISSIVPNSGPEGTIVLITGSGFSTNATDNTVTLNGKTCTVNSASATELTITIPPEAGNGSIQVTANNATGQSPNSIDLFTTTTIMVSTLAGSTQGYADDTGTMARFNGPTGVAVDAAGNVYVADRLNNRIRKIAPVGLGVSTLAGGNTAGDADGTGSEAQFNYPAGVAVDTQGNVYVADQVNHKIRKITPEGVVSTLAGGSTYGYADGPGSEAKFFGPTGVAVDAGGNVYVADAGNHKIRTIAPDGVVSTLAGSTIGYVDGSAGGVDDTDRATKFNYPAGVAVDGAGNVYVADRGNNRIRIIIRNGVYTLAGSTPGYANGREAQFDSPFGVAVNPLGSVGQGGIYVADRNNNKIRKIYHGPLSYFANTWAGSTQGYVDGTGSEAQFYSPIGVAVDAAGNVYVADEKNHTIRKITLE
jgi:sugar lactone lactonase YvrE